MAPITRCFSFGHFQLRFRPQQSRLAAAAALWIALAAALPGAAGAISLGESFERFPGAVQVEAEFGSFDDLQINGDQISGTGFLFRVRNTSYADGGAAAFAIRPDRHFTEHKSLTPEAIQALSDAQPFGLYAFEVELPADAGVLISAPAGFELRRERSDDGADWIELSFRIDLAHAAGLLFDDAAPTPSELFGTPRYGFLEFFISTASGEIADYLLAEDDDDDGDSEGDGDSELEVSTSLAWIQGGEIATRFDAPHEDFDDRRLRPHGELLAQFQPIPEPRTVAQVALGLLVLARIGRPRGDRT